MSFTFRKAARENAHVIVGLGGGTGSGKTYSALRLAAGLSDGKRFAVIDTEAGRATHYADSFDFDHGDLAAPFRPAAYTEAITAAADAGYPVIVVDSMSHEHAGEGGLLDWFEEEHAKTNYSDKKKAGCWIKPKVAHKAMVQKMLQLRAHLILCYRAEEKLILEPDIKKGEKKYDMKWKPVLARGLEFEMLASFLLHHETPGRPTDPLKLPEQLRPYFNPASPISEETGRGIAEWAGGGKVSAGLADAYGAIAGCRTPDELKLIGAKLKDAGLSKADATKARKAFKTRSGELAA